MKTTAKKRRKLLPAIAMLTVSAIMLSTATYAWFTMNKDAHVTNIELTASTPSSIEISLGHYDETAKTAALDAGKDKWAITVSFDELYKNIGALMPASNSSGAADKFFAATDAVSAGTATAFKAVDKMSGIAYAAGETPDKGYYVDIPVWLRTRGSTEDAAITLNQTSSFVLSTAGDTGTKISKSVRVAFIADAPTTEAPSATATSMWNPNGGEYFTAGGAVSAIDPDVAKAMPNFLKETTLDSNNAVTQTGNTIVTLPAVTGDDPAGTGAPRKVILRIWIEGEDNACLNENAGATFIGNIDFFNVADTSKDNA